MMNTTNAAHMPVMLAWKLDIAFKKPNSSLIELPVMKLKTCAVQLLWEGALVAADSGYC